MTYRYDPNEDIQLKLGDRNLKDGDQVLFSIDFAWHDTEDQLHFNLKDIRDYLSKKESMTVLLREESFVNGNGEEVIFYPFKVTEIV